MSTDNQSNSKQLPHYLQNLNQPQREAVLHFLGPILVLAGAGSGKTRVLTNRIVNLVLNHKVKPYEILAVTFTNKATDEMRHRLANLLGDSSKDLWIATFHSSALRILRRHAKNLGYSSDFAVYDTQDTKAVLKGVIKELDLDEKKYPASAASKFIDQAKNSFVLPDEFAASEKIEIAPDFVKKIYSSIYTKYQEALLKSNAMDFGDLLVNVVLLFNKFPDILSYYQHKLKFVLVDEYQDTNHVQYLFVKAITAHYKNLLVVGDDDQSIYAFRGATIRNILDFEKDFENTKVVKLEENYRSTGNILKAAHAVIEKNTARKDKKLWTSTGDGEKIVTSVSWDETEEADFIGREILELTKKDYKFSDIAVFYRTNAQSRAIEEALVGYEIPYKIYGGLRFYDRKEVKDIIAYVRLLVNEFDSQAFFRIINTPTRGIGAQSVKNISDFAEEKGISLIAAATEMKTKNKSLGKFVDLIETLKSEARRSNLSNLVRKIIDLTDYALSLSSSKDPTAQSRLENIKELEALSRTFENTSEDRFEVIRTFLDKVTLSSSADNAEVSEEERLEKEKQGVVSLMTLHLAKGLEYPAVFFTGLEEGLLPHYKSMEFQDDIAEERRLTYVGITRAMKKLYLTRAKSRGMFSAGGDGFGGGGIYRETSRFMYDVPSDTYISENGSSGSDGFFSIDTSKISGFSREDEDSRHDEEHSYDDVIIRRKNSAVSVSSDKHYESDDVTSKDLVDSDISSLSLKKKPKDKKKKSFMIRSADDL